MASSSPSHGSPTDIGFKKKPAMAEEAPVIKRLYLPQIGDAETKSLSVRRPRLDSVRSRDSSALSEYNNKESRETSADKISNHSSAQKRKIHDTHFEKRRKQKPLDEVEEVYEELNDFIGHARLASKSFLYLFWFALKFLIVNLFTKVINPVAKFLLWLIFMLFVLICTIIAFVGDKIHRTFKKSKSPFHDPKNLMRIMKFDKIWESKKFTLVFGLHGTLVYVSKKKLKETNKLIKSDKLGYTPLGEKGWQELYVYPRPKLEEALAQLAEHFNLVVFTKSDQAWTDKLVDHIDTWKVIQRRFSRDSCDIEHNGIRKNLLRLFPGSDLNEILMIEEDSGLCMQPKNTIKIKKWEAQSIDDNVLEQLTTVLIDTLKKDPENVMAFRDAFAKTYKPTINIENHDDDDGKESEIAIQTPRVLETDVTSPQGEETEAEHDPVLYPVAPFHFTK